MAENVAPEEAEALQEPLEDIASSLAREVLGRDFRRPMRLSAAQLGEVREGVQAGLTQIDAFVRGFLGDEAACDIDEVTEDNAESVIAQLEPPFAVGRFAIGGQPAWITWQAGPALATVGYLLGEEPSEELPERPLSHVERRILGGFFNGLTEAVLAVFQEPAAEISLVREAYELGSWRDGEPANADSHRLCISLALEGPVPRSVVRIYLPGFQPTGAAEADKKAGAALPGHLKNVDVRVRAVLGHCEIALAELMSLEEGDVIPLDGEGGRVQLTVEDQPCATARLGQRHGKYALRLDQVLTQPLLHEEEQ